MQNILLTNIKREATTADKEILSFDYYPVNSIHYILNGQGYFNGMHLKKGDGFIVFKGTSTCYYPDKTDPWEYLWIDVVGSKVDSSTCVCNPGNATFRFLHDKYFDALTSFISEFLPFRITDSTFCAAYASLMTSMHIVDNDTGSQKSISRQYVENAKKYIFENFHSHISIENVANNLYISRAYLRNIFYKYEGVSPQQFLIQTRIEKAKDLLLTTNMSAAQISYAVGYSDILQFYKAFKKHVGVSAGEYRTAANCESAENKNELLR